MQDSDELIAVDLATQAIKWRMPTGPMPADIFGIHDDKTLLVGLTGSDGVQVFDVRGRAAASWSARSRPARARTRSAPPATAATCSSATAWPTPSAGSTCRRSQVVDTYPVPGGPDCMDVSADGKTLLRDLALGQEAHHRRPRQRTRWCGR